MPASAQGPVAFDPAPPVVRPMLDDRHASGVRVVSLRVADGVIIDAPWEQEHGRQREEGETADGRFHGS